MEGGRSDQRLWPSTRLPMLKLPYLAYLPQFVFCHPYSLRFEVPRCPCPLGWPFIDCIGQCL
ncbi:hypothetical protein CONLIGDRAFT_483525 [Coniochaeta ligniaria NRRL 30616]|uniref:Uncharacterized protein n=1 Tax=Coniochaeta ligniaria NRRL 30616 TaxID=1408157 RepID=A0A1J7IGW6_9PEZI|nr:hypothetical protein CONLIGDRAFT_483525 [Coniochaeta ligniaria NRRL 30616]